MWIQDDDQYINIHSDSLKRKKKYIFKINKMKYKNLYRNDIHMFVFV